MINLKETLIPLSEVPNHLPGNPHIATIHRWIATGCRGIKLESLLVGGTRYTSTEALERFVLETTAAANAKSQSIPSDSHRELDSIGI